MRISPHATSVALDMSHQIQSASHAPTTIQSTIVSIPMERSLAFRVCIAVYRRCWHCAHLLRAGAFSTLATDCTDETNLIASDCYEGYYFAASHSCVPCTSVERVSSQLDEMSYSGDTKGGSGHCATCDKTTGACLSCKTGYLYDYATGSCLQCAAGFYNTGTTPIVCDACLTDVACDVGIWMTWSLCRSRSLQ